VRNCKKIFENYPNMTLLELEEIADRKNLPPGDGGEEKQETSCFLEMYEAFQNFQNQWAGLRDDLDLLQKSLTNEKQWNQLMKLIELVDDTEKSWISIMRNYQKLHDCGNDPAPL